LALLNAQARGDRLSPESRVVKSLVLFTQVYLEENPGKQIEGPGQLKKYFGPPKLDHTYAWLPLEQRYVYVKPGSGRVPDRDGGEVLAICTVPLSKYELEENDDPDPEKNPPGRYIIWRADYGKVYGYWFPETEIRKFIKSEVLNAITLPKPKIPPRERISIDPATGEIKDSSSAPTTHVESGSSPTATPREPLAVRQAQESMVGIWVIGIAAVAVAVFLIWKRYT
jgi:hypothetical protein